MNVYRLFFNLFLICGLLSFSSYADGTEFGSCCYNIDDGRLTSGEQDTDGKYYCVSETLFIGEANAFSCSHYVPLYAKSEDGTCFGFEGSSAGSELPFYITGTDVSGFPIYASSTSDSSISTILDYLTLDVGAQFRPINHIWYTDSSCSTPLTSDSGVNPGNGGDSGNQNPIDSGDSGIITNPYDPSDFDFENEKLQIPSQSYYPITYYRDLDRNFTSYENVFDGCSVQNGIDNFFSPSIACNSISSSSGERQCFYNSFSIGDLVGLEFSSLNSQNFCTSLTSVTSCSDYQNEYSCTQNVAYDLENSYASKHPDLSNGCSWVPSEDVSSFSSAARGVCISNYVEPTQQGFEEVEYSQRLNLFENPSFELGTSRWDRTNPSNVIEGDIESYFGDKSYLLDPSSTISQKISGVSYRNYLFSLSLLPNNVSSDEEVSLDVRVTFFNDAGVELEEFRLIPTNGYYTSSESSQSLPLFKRVFFDLFTIPETTSSFEISLTNNGAQSLYLDAMNVEEISDLGTSYYKPISIVPSEASSCGECFVDGSYNTCTEEKSASLGACTYMVSNASLSYGEEFIDRALGKENMYTQPELAWQSQSLSTSTIFCELYQNESQCVDPSNSINSLYGSSCSWSQEYGCFKNTYEQSLGVPDHIDMSTILDNPSISWEQSCDLLAPEVYAVLLGKDGLGEFHIFDGSSSLGEIYFHYQLSDVSLSELESCENYDVLSQVYFHYNVTYMDISGPQTVVRTFPLATQSTLDISPIATDLLSNFIVGHSQDSGITLPLDSVERQYRILDKEIISLEISIFDQSGNVGYERDVPINFDANGPTLDLVSHNEIAFGNTGNIFTLDNPNIFPINSLFEFKANDTNTIAYCDFRLLGGASSIYDAGWLEVENFTGSSSVDFSIDLARVISQTPATGDTFALEVRCLDSFNQASSYIYTDLRVSLSVDISPIYPPEFSFDYDNLTQDQVYLISDGIISSTEEMYFYTNDAGTSCSHTLNGVNGNSAWTTEELDTPFEIVLDNGFTKTFSHLVSSTVSFGSDGRKEVKLSCSGNLGSFEEDLVYLADTQNPINAQISLLGDNPRMFNDGTFTYLSLPRGSQTQLHSFPNEINPVPYINPSLLNLDFLLEVDGTGSWISPEAEFMMFSSNSNNTLSLVPRPMLLSNLYLEHNTSKSSVYEANATFSIPPISTSDFTLPGLEFTNVQNSPYLYMMNFGMNVFDLGNNSVFVEYDLLIDNSTPQISFGGDIGSMDSTSRLIFSRSEDPIIELSFSTPNYRKHSCVAELERGAQRFLPYNLSNGAMQSSFVFSLGDIVQGPVDISLQDYYLTLDCVDVYGDPLGITKYKLIFDDEAPKFDEVGFLPGNDFSRYLPTPTSYLSEITSSLDVILLEDEQYGVTCTVEPSSMASSYSCDSFESFSFRGVSTSPMIRLFSEDSRVSQGNESYACATTPTFWNAIPYGVDNTQELEFNVLCRDAAGNENSTSFSIGVNHYDSILASINFTYDQERAYPTFYFLNEIVGGTVAEFYYIDQDGQEQFLKSFSLPSIPANSYHESSVYLNLSEIELSDRESVEIRVHLLGEVTSTTLKKDTTAPLISLMMPMVEDGKLDSSSTSVLFSAFDELSNPLDVLLLIEKDSSGVFVPLYIKNVSFESSLNSLYSSNESPLSPNDLSQQIGMVISDLGFDSTYEITLIAEDTSGFISSETISFSLDVPRVVLEGSSIFENPITGEYFTITQVPSMKLAPSLNVPLSCDLGYAQGILSNGALSSSTYEISLFDDLSFTLPEPLGFGSLFTSVQMNFNCDLDGSLVQSQYVLHYDNSEFEIVNSSMKSGIEEYFLPNKQNLVLPSLVDGLRVMFSESEPYALCSFTLRDSTSYTCNSNQSFFEGSGNSLLSEDFELLSFTQGNSSFCSPSSSLVLDGVSDIETSLLIDVSCEDVFGVVSQDLVTLPITYTTSTLLNVIPTISGDSLLLSLESLELENGFHSLQVELDGEFYDVSYNVVGFSNGIFTYQLSGVDISSLEPASLYVGNLHLLANGVSLESREFSFVYDTQGPELDFTLLSNGINNSIYFEDFSFRITSEDLISDVDSLEILVNSESVFYRGSEFEEFIDGSVLGIEKTLSSAGSLGFDLRYFGGFDSTTLVLEFISKDAQGNSASLSQEIYLDDSIVFLLDDSVTSFAHSSNDYWLSEVKYPVISFFTNQNFTRCNAAGIGDFDAIGGGVYELNLGDYSDVDYDRVLDVYINCIGPQNDLLTYSKNLYFVDTLPDFTITSSDGFLLTDDIGIVEYIITSVVPPHVDELQCSYSFGSQESIVLSNDNYAPSHSIFINTSELSPQDYSLSVSCSDILGRTHDVEKTVENALFEGLELSNFEIVSGDLAFELTTSEVLVLDDTRDYVLSFSSNKMETSCSISIMEISLFNIVLNFFESLFSLNEQSIFPQSPYVFRTELLSLGSGEYDINLFCTANDGQSSVDQTFTLELTNTSENEVPEFEVLFP